MRSCTRSASQRACFEGVHGAGAERTVLQRAVTHRTLKEGSVRHRSVRAPTVTHTSSTKHGGTLNTARAQGVALGHLKTLSRKTAVTHGRPAPLHRKGILKKRDTNEDRNVRH